MIVSTTNPEYTNLMHLVYDLVQQLIDSGYRLEYSQNYSERVGNRYLATTPGTDGELDRDKTGLYVIAPTSAVDPLYYHQPWRMVIQVDFYYINFWITTPSGYTIDDDTKAFTFKTVHDYHAKRPEQMASSHSIFTYGCLTPNGGFDPDVYRGSFFNAKNACTPWNCFNSEREEGELTASREVPIFEDNPLTYKVSIGKQGIAFAMWSTRDTAIGNCQAWFVAQRVISHEGTFDPTIGYSVMKCVFSQDGGGYDALGLDGEQKGSKKFNPLGVMQFEVREKDVDLPTFPYSAVLPTYRGKPIINTEQQVCRVEGSSSPELQFMENPASNRFVTSGILDLMAYTDATSLEQGDEVELDLFGDGNLRTYEALGANMENSNGMRMLIATKGEDVNFDSPPIYHLAFRQQNVDRTPPHPNGSQPMLSIAVYDENNVIRKAPYDMPFGIRIVDDSTAQGYYDPLFIGLGVGSIQPLDNAYVPANEFDNLLWFSLHEPPAPAYITVELYDLTTGDVLDVGTLRFT